MIEKTINSGLNAKFVDFRVRVYGTDPYCEKTGNLYVFGDRKYMPVALVLFLRERIVVEVQLSMDNNLPDEQKAAMAERHFLSAGGYKLEWDDTYTARVDITDICRSYYDNYLRVNHSTSDINSYTTDITDFFNKNGDYPLFIGFTDDAGTDIIQAEVFALFNKFVRLYNAFAPSRRFGMDSYFVERYGSNVDWESESDYFTKNALCPAPNVVYKRRSSYDGKFIFLAPAPIIEERLLYAVSNVRYVCSQYCGYSYDHTPYGSMHNKMDTAYLQESGYVYFDAGDLNKYYQIIDLDDMWIANSEYESSGECAKAVCLMWLSSWGGWRRLLFKVRDYKETATSRELLSTFDEYNTQRGKEVEYTAYIEGLDMQSYRYYADIITSPRVYATFDRAFIDSQEIIFRVEGVSQLDVFAPDECQRVQIATKEVTLPNNDNKLYEFAVQIKSKHYDTI